MVDFDIGDVLAGKYEIKQVLGVGGMGKVYRARQVDLGRDVALKIPSEAVLQSPEVMARFSREAKTVAKLSHDNIVQVYEYFHEDDLAYIAMEYVEGEDLKALTTRAPRDLKVGDLAKILEMACDGMANAHEHGIVHRDIKPHNIMVARLPRGRWRVKVMDFGIAHIDPSTQFMEAGSQLTQTGQALGTPSYMSPEQIRGSNVSHLSDIYSFGCVVYYVFTQSTVFSGSGLTIAVSHLNETPPSIRSRIPNLSEEFEHVIQQCLEKDPAKRPQDAAELGARLFAALQENADLDMWEVWKSARKSSDQIIPIIGSGEEGETGSASNQLVEVETQHTLARTDPLAPPDMNDAPTMLDDRSSEGITQTTPPGTGDIHSSKTIVTSPPFAADEDKPAAAAGSQRRTPSKNLLIWGIVALACLFAGVGVAVIVGSSEDETQAAIIPPVVTPEKTPPPVGTPVTTPIPIEKTPEPTPDDTPAVTPEKTPERTPRPTPEPTPSPVPSPTPDMRVTQLNALRDRANDTRDFVSQVNYWAKIMELYTPADEEFSNQVLLIADNIANRVVRGPEMISVSGGLFSMGSDASDAYQNEEPVHNVRLSPYRIGKYEVTALEFATFLNDNETIASVIYEPSGKSTVYFDDDLNRYMPRKGKELHPANKVSWAAARDYAEWLSRITGKLFRLPTEAEWERAARGSPPARYPWGDSPPSRTEVNFSNASGTVPVNAMSEGQSLEGAFHMAGNVAEWVYDWYDEDYYAAASNADPRGPDLEDDPNARRVHRGGSFLSPSESDLVSSRRFRMRPERMEEDLGFRLAESIN